MVAARGNQAQAKAALNHAFNGGMVSSDLAWRRVKPFNAVGQARKVILSESEIQRLINACPLVYVIWSRSAP